jgi:hypothetical protein
MNRSEFENFMSNEPTGIVLFYSNHCRVCETQKLLLSRAIPEKYETVCCDDDVEFYITNHNIDQIPVVIIYENGIPVWRRDDLLQPEDVHFLIDYAKGF